MNDAPRRGPTRLLPPLMFGAVFLAGVWVELAYTRLRIFDGMPERQRVTVGLALVAAGLLLMLWAAIVMWTSRTTVLPYRAATTLVRRGPFRFTRNPIYVADVLTYLGTGVALDAGWPIVFLPVAVLLVHFLVVRKEEKHLRASFGSEYDEYRVRVRRWV